MLLKTRKMVTDEDIRREYERKGFIPYRQFKRNGRSFVSKEDSLYFTNVETERVLDMLFSIQDHYKDKYPKLDFENQDILTLEESRDRPDMDMIYIKLNVTPFLK